MNLISIETVIELTGLSRSTLAKRRCTGTGPVYYKIGRQVKYDLADVNKWIASRRRTSTWAANNNRQSAEAV